MNGNSRPMRDVQPKEAAQAQMEWWPYALLLVLLQGGLFFLAGCLISVYRLNYLLLWVPAVLLVLYVMVDAVACRLPNGFLWGLVVTFLPVVGACLYARRRAQRVTA